MKRWEYLATAITSDTTAEDFDALGAKGWELAAISGAVAFFKRDMGAAALAEQAEQHARERGEP